MFHATPKSSNMILKESKEKETKILFLHKMAPTTFPGSKDFYVPGFSVLESLELCKEVE